MEKYEISVKNTKIDVLYEFDKSLPVVQFKLIFKNVGSLGEKIEGLGKLTSNLLKEGTKTLGGSEFARLLDIKASSIFSYCENDKFVINLSSLKENFKFSLEMLTKLLQEPNLTQSVLEKIKTEMLGEIAMLKTEFDYIANINLQKMLFKGTLLGNDSNGNEESIAKITLDDVRDFLGNLCLENLAVVLCGDSEFSEDDIKKVLQILPNSKKHKLPFYEANDECESKEIYEDSEQAYIYFGSPFYVDKNEEFIAKTALFVLGSSGFGSRLLEEIRVKRGLAYSAYARADFSLFARKFSGYLQTKNESKNEAIAVVRDEIAKFVKFGVNSDELEQAKKFLLGSAVLQKETMFKRVSILVDEYLRGYEFGEFERNLERIKALNLDDLNKFIKSHDEICKLSFCVVCKK
ncbi:MAG: insulinase family protein [Campylobacter sp.]|nr:insulinase family protein [Campylobacter sp.]